MMYICAQTHHGREALADDNLRRQGLETFLPTYREQRKDGSEVVRYLFPSYIFIAMEAMEYWPIVHRSIGIKQVLTFHPNKKEYIEPSLLSSEAIETLRRSATLDEQKEARRITAGCYVKILSGVFAGQAESALVEWADNTRATLLISIFNRRVRAQFYLRDLIHAESFS